MLFLRLFSGCLLQLSPFAMLCLYPFGGHFRISNKKTFFLTASLLVTISALFGIIVVHLRTSVAAENLFAACNTVFLLCLLLCLLFYLIIVKDFWQKKLFAFTFVMITALDMTSLNNAICTKMLAGVPPDNMPYQGAALPVLLVITAAIVPAIFLVLKREILPLNKFFLPDDYGWLCVLSGILLLVLASGLIPIDYSNIDNPMTVYLFLALQISVLLIYIVVFRLAKKIIITEQQLSQSEAQRQIQTEQYRVLMEKITETRRARHDTRHRLLAMRQYLTAGNTGQLLAQIDSQINALDSLTIEQYSENALLNLLVSHYMELANTAGVRMTAKVSCQKELKISAPELSVLLGNMLENGLYAASKAEEEFRYMKLNILQKANMLVITLDNGFDGKTNKKDGIYMSTKSDHGGLGLSSIAGIAQHNGGGSEFTNEGKIFHSSVMLQV